MINEKLPNGMTKTEILESLKSYTDFPEVIDEAIKALTPKINIISREMLNTLKEVRNQCASGWGNDECSGCPFVDDKLYCRLNNYPDRWKLDISKKFLGESED